MPSEHYIIRAGTGTETLAGFVYQQTVDGVSKRTWMPGISERGAKTIVRGKENLDWCRGFIVEGRLRVILA